MLGTWATGNDVGVHHHGRQSPIAIERVIAGNLRVMFVGFAVATRPLIEGTAVDFGPPQDVS